MFDLFNKKKLPDIAKKWLPYFYQFNIREKHFWLEKDHLRKKFNRNPPDVKKKHGVEPADGDVIWSMFNAVLQTRKNEYDSGQVFYRMGEFLIDDEKKVFQGMTSHTRGDILVFKSSGVVSGIEIVTCDTASEDKPCAECKKLEGKEYSLDEAFKKSPIPNRKCTHEKGCRCTYKSVGR